MDSPTTVETATELHRWVKLTKASLEKAEPGLYGLLICPGLNRLNVFVCKDSIPRSMLIWDQLLKAVETSRLKVRMQKEYPGRTIVAVDGEDLSIRLREKVTRKEHIPTSEEKERMKGVFHYSTWDHFPSGKLVLVVEYQTVNHVWVDGFTWTDSEKKRIEDRLESFTQALLDLAKRLKEGRVRAEERQRIWKEEERLRQEAARLQAEEKKRCEQLERQASTWTVTCSIRGFVAAVRDEATSRQGAIEQGSPLDQWLQWAERYAASLDPVGSVLAGAGPGEKGG